MLFKAKVRAEKDREVIKRLGKQLYEEGYVKDSYIGAVIEREKELPTGLKTGSINVAIPHTDIMHVNETFLAIATLENPVKFRLMEDPSQEVDIDIVFLLGVKQPKEQTKLLSALMAIFKDDQSLEKIKNAQSEEDCNEILKLVQIQ